jgi:hypothetical protein
MRLKGRYVVEQVYLYFSPSTSSSTPTAYLPIEPELSRSLEVHPHAKRRYNTVRPTSSILTRIPQLLMTIPNQATTDLGLYRTDSQATKVSSETPKASKPFSLTSPPRPPVDIFSPRPETPAPPPEIPFLASPISRRQKVVPLPPTPPRNIRNRERRKALSADHALEVVKHKCSFERALAAFPAPPSRAGSSLFSRSLPASPFPSRMLLPDQDESRRLEQSREGAEEKRMREDSEPMEWGSDDSDCRTITGIPATPSTASSDWDNFWSEVCLFNCTSI